MNRSFLEEIAYMQSMAHGRALSAVKSIDDYGSRSAMGSIRRQKRAALFYARAREAYELLSAIATMV